MRDPQTSDQVTLSFLSLDGTLEPPAPRCFQAPDLDAAEVRIGRDLNGNGVAGATHYRSTFSPDRWSQCSKHGQQRRAPAQSLRVQHKGLVVSRDGIPYPR